MNHLIKLCAFALLSLLLLNACASRRIVIAAPEVQRTQINTWAQQTNVEEDVDVSDIDEEKISTVRDTPLVESKMERVPFSIAEYQQFAKNGNGTVKGHIYLKDAYDKRVLGANTRLYLNPVTSYSKQWYYESYLAGHKMQKADSRLFNYLRFTSANEQGQFAFYGVPYGRYYLIGTVRCASQCGYATAKNVRIASEISISGNQVIEKELSKLID